MDGEFDDITVSRKRAALERSLSENVRSDPGILEMENAGGVVLRVSPNVCADELAQSIKDMYGEIFPPESKPNYLEAPDAGNTTSFGRNSEDPSKDMNTTDICISSLHRDQGSALATLNSQVCSLGDKTVADLNSRNNAVGFGYLNLLLIFF